MKKIREKIIHTSAHEAEKNRFLFYNEIAKIKAYTTHSKVWVVDRYDETGKLQPILLLNCDSYSLPHNVARDYGVLVLTPFASRYKEAVGILVRKTYSSYDEEDEKKENILTTKIKTLGINLK